MNIHEFIKVVKDDKNIELVDIREADEIAEYSSNLNAQSIPMGALLRQGVSRSLSKDRPIIVFCRSGYRAKIVARELTVLGYNIEPVEGGLAALEEMYKNKSI